MRSSTMGNIDLMILVNAISFDKSSAIGDPVSQAKIYQSQAADELIFLDIDANKHNNTRQLVEIIRSAANEIFMPITVGGGINNIDTIRELLLNGADKVSINTAAFENKEFISEATDCFGSQCIVVGIDYSKKTKDSQYKVFLKGGSVETKMDPVTYAIEAEKYGAGEILLTSIDMDGSQSGLDIEMTSLISSAVSIPVITSGGCGKANHFIQGFKEGKASAVAAGTFFSYKDQNLMQTRAHIANAGIPIRIVT
mgnify:CR=1 FL=1